MNTCRYFFISLCLCIGAGTWIAKGEDIDQEAKKVPIPIFQGIGLRVDLGNGIYEVATTQGKGLSVEAAIYSNLLHKYFPTIELGYGQRTRSTTNSAIYNGNGMFTRIGCDFNMLKPTDDNPNFFTIGLRYGMSMQNFSINNLQIIDPYWETIKPLPQHEQFKFDCWGEIIAGVQVKVYQGFNMGWAVRIKLLITRAKESDYYADYIPGFGHTNNTQFSFNYYIGYHF